MLEMMPPRSDYEGELLVADYEPPDEALPQLFTSPTWEMSGVGHGGIIPRCRGPVMTRAGKSDNPFGVADIEVSSRMD